MASPTYRKADAQQGGATKNTGMQPATVNGLLGTQSSGAPSVGGQSIGSAQVADYHKKQP